MVDIGGLVGGFAELGTVTIVLIAAVAVALLLVVLLLFRARGRGGGADVYGVVISDSQSTVTLIPFVRVGEGVYASTGTDHPMFLVVPQGTKMYWCHFGGRRLPCYFAGAYDLLALPLDPKVLSDLSLLLSSERMSNVKIENARDLMLALYKMEELKVGNVRISPELNVSIAFDIKPVVSQVLSRIFLGATLAVKHAFWTAKSYEALSQYIEKLGVYAARRYSWLMYLALLVLAGGLAVGVIFAFRAITGGS